MRGEMEQDNAERHPGAEPRATKAIREDAERQAAEDMLGLMTPVVKGVLTDKGFDHAVAAQQVYGGHGYIEEHGMSQFVRDARIAMTRADWRRAWPYSASGVRVGHAARRCG